LDSLSLGLAIVVLIALCAVAVWFASLTFATLSGWRRLSERYAAQRRPTGSTIRTRSGKIGNVSYSNLLTVRVAQDGLFLSTLAPAHKTLFFPWLGLQGELQVAEGEAAYTRFHAGYPPVEIELPRQVIELVQAAQRG